jgi:hypothetical protein
MKATRTAFALAFLAALAPAWAVPQDKVRLAWKFKEGQTLVFRSAQKNITSFGGQSMEQEQVQTFAFGIKTVDAQGAADVEMKVTAIAVKASGIQEMEWDSEKDKEAPENPQAKMLSRMIGQAFQMKMAPSGKVLEVKGMEKLLETMLKDMGPEAQMAAMQLKQMFSDDAYKGMMQQMAPQLPETPVAKGDTWKSDFTLKIPMMGGLKFAITSRLADFKGDEAHIEQDISMEMKENADPDNPLAGFMEIKGARGKAASVFSVGRGLFLTQTSSMEMVISANGQEIPVRTEGTFKLVETAKKDF